MASQNNQNNPYDVKEYFLYNCATKQYKLYEQMINRFFKNNAYIVLKLVRNKIQSSNSPIRNVEFYQIYKKFIFTQRPDMIKLIHADTWRQKSFIKSVELLFSDEGKIAQDSIYIDYGCNDGAFAVAIVKHFGLKPKNIYCCDLIDMPELVKEAKFNYIKIDVNNIKKSMSSVPMGDILTIVNVFHHIPPDVRGETLNVLDEKLKKNSYIIVKEHNCNMGLYNEEYKELIKEWHKLYAVLYNEQDFMGKINFISLDHLKAYMFSIHSLLKAYIIEDENDILKSYFALFVKYRELSQIIS